MKYLLANQREEWIQRCAWRLVRSAEDMIGAGRGNEKFLWAVERLRTEFPNLKETAEDYVRAAFINFKIETKSILPY